MTHLDIFGQFRPFAIGFDRYFEDLERMSNHTQTQFKRAKTSDATYNPK